MGNIRSTFKKTLESKINHGDTQKIKTRIDRQFSNDIHGDRVEDVELKILRWTIEHNPDLFILNNLMMSIQFFENFEQEITNVQQKLVSFRESELNARLPSQKRAFVPDVLQEHVAQFIEFTHVESALIRSVEPLQPIRIYIVFDNIEITEQSSVSYSSLNETIIYTMQLKPSRHKGYALLQRLEVNPSKKKKESSCSEAIYSDSDSLYNDSKTNPNDNTFIESDKKSGGSLSLTPSSSDVNAEHFYERENNAYCIVNDQQGKKEETKRNKKDINSSRRGVYRTRQNQKTKNRSDQNLSPAGSVSSGYKSGNYAIDSDSEYGYDDSSITRNNVSKIRSTTNDTLQYISEIPCQCFEIYDPIKEKRHRLSSKDRLIKGFIHSRKYDVWHINSSKFMKYFYKIYNEQLSLLMGLNTDVNELQGAFVNCHMLKVSETSGVIIDDEFAIAPCIWSAWPYMAEEWLIRPRSTWPDYNIVEKIKTMGCYIIPEGFHNENSSNRNSEWELTFPAAEHYLETCLSHSQLHIYLMALVLQKTYMRPLNSYVGLTDAHIRNQLFWLIEDNDTLSKWHDNRMGEGLITLLKTLYRAISQDVPTMPDYFIRDKNIFKSNVSLHRSQKQLKRILENPVMYVLHAMQNITYPRNSFPKFDHAMLLKILTEDVLTLINPHLTNHQVLKFQPKSSNFQDELYDRDGFWSSAENMKDQKNVYVKKTLTTKTLINTRTSHDQVIEITVRCAELDSRRLCLVFDLFIRHFIKIAECCHKYGALLQKSLCVAQAERLSVLLSEHGNHSNAKVYLDQLEALKKRAVRMRSQIDGPETPRRNIDRSVYSSSLNDRYKYPVESQPNFIEIVTPSETNKITPADPTVFKQKLSPLQQKEMTMAIVHEVELGPSNMDPPSKPDKITKNENGDSFQIVSLNQSQYKSSNMIDTYI